ncbi:response regulator [Azohydromonas aeria]|uniref:response regulator n=1 Tax=Azohydromonas aeria TaxID=2590212 RepID=UPI0012FB6E0A|nr:response regulator transcription factor [Azohydromonas aeria]
MTAATRVLLVDDHRLVREAIAQTLRQEPGVEVAGEAGNAANALELAASLRPDVIVMDIHLPDRSGIELAPQLQRAQPGVRIVALSAYTDKRYVIEMLRAGALGYVTKSAAGFELVMAIRAVMAGQSYISPEVAGALVSSLHGGEPALDAARLLGRREVEILKLIAQGQRTPAIAASLQISPATVDAHRRNIMRKLDIHTVADLTRYAIRQGLVSL